MKDRLKTLLQEMGMSQAEFADSIGVGRPSITHIMTGRDKTSQTVVSKTLLRFPEINPMWLLKGEGEMFRPGVGKNFSQKTENVPDIDESTQEPQIKETQTEIQTSMFQDDSDEGNVAEVQEIPQPEAIKPMPEPVTPKPEVRQPRPVHVAPEPEVRQPMPEPPVAPKPEELSKPETAVKIERKLRKIVFFYSDHSFEEYFPGDL